MAVLPLQHSVLVLVEVHYKRGIPEKYEMVMAPVGRGTLVCVGMHSPHAGDSRERMHAWPIQQYDCEALCAVHVLSACLFGDGRATPRIIGAPDWVEVTLEVLALGGRKPR